MKRMLMITVAGAALLAFTAPAWAQDGKAEQGKKVFDAQKCVMCHSVAGKGNPKGPLDGVGSKYSAAELKTWITDPKTMAEKTKAERKPPMRAFTTLPAADLDALVAYLQTLKKK